MGARRRTRTSTSRIEWPDEERQPTLRSDIRKGKIRSAAQADPITQLMAGGPPGGTEPERIVYGYLAREGLLFDYQFPIQGGRAVAGGLVVDFVIWDMTPHLIIRVQSWWHRQPEIAEVDLVQRHILETSGFRVADIWEEDIRDYDRLDMRMREILYAQRIGLGAPPMGPGALHPPERPACCDEPRHWRWYQHA